MEDILMVSVGGLATVLAVAWFAPDPVRVKWESHLTTLWVSFFILALVSGIGLAV